MRSCVSCHRTYQTGRGPRCPECRVAEQRRRDAWRGSPEARGYDGDWRRLRVTVLERDRGACVVCHGPGADRIVQTEQGDRLDPSTYVSSHTSCRISVVRR